MHSTDAMRQMSSDDRHYREKTNEAELQIKFPYWSRTDAHVLIQLARELSKEHLTTPPSDRATLLLMCIRLQTPCHEKDVSERVGVLLHTTDRSAR